MAVKVPPFEECLRSKGLGEVKFRGSLSLVDQTPLSLSICLTVQGQTEMHIPQIVSSTPIFVTARWAAPLAHAEASKKESR